MRSLAPKAVAALVAHDLADPRVATQSLHDPLSPAGGRRRVLMQEVSTGLQLEPVDLHCKPEQRHGLSATPSNLGRAPAMPIEVLDRAEVRAWRAADHNEGLLLPDLCAGPPAMVGSEEVPRHAVGVTPQVEGGAADQRHMREAPQLSRDPGRAVELGHLRSDVPRLTPWISSIS